MSQNDQLIIAATAIRDYLSELLPPEDALECDRQIEILLSQIATNQAQPSQLTALLSQAESTREWTRRFLKGEAPQYIPKGITTKIGEPSAEAREAEYECPECHTTYAELPGGRVPTCKHDNRDVQLIKITGA
jgi:non-ribosomal peptide synthetase component F